MYEVEGHVLLAGSKKVLYLGITRLCKENLFIDESTSGDILYGGTMEGKGKKTCIDL